MSLLGKLKGGDLRSIGRSNEVVADVLKAPDRLDELFDGLFHNEAVVRARSADALEKISLRHPDWLHRFSERLIRDVAPLEQKEVRWHVAQMLGREKLTSRQREAAFAILADYFQNSDSQIVKVTALQALADLAETDPRFRAKASQFVRQATDGGSKSVRARARKLLA